MIKIKAFYIQETDKPSWFKRVLNITEVQNNKIIVQPMENKINNKQMKKTINKINTICKKYDVHNVILSRNLRNNQELKNNIIGCDLNIFDGRWLISYMTYEIVDYIMQKTNKRNEETEITILTNAAADIVIQSIRLFAKELKRINIVTNHINEFKYLEKKIFEEYGMMITVTNNKRKSLAKAELIINFDFVEEVLNKYNIYEQAVILNLEGDIKINKKRFNGLNVNDYEICSKRAEDNFEPPILKEFCLKDLLEAKIYRKDTFANIRYDITKSHYKIKELYGKSGVLFD